MVARQATKLSPNVPGQEKLLSFVDEIEQRLETVETNCRKRQWAFYLHAKTSSLLQCERERAALLLDEDIWFTVMRWVGELAPTNPVQRRLTLLGRRLIPARVDCQSDVYELRHQLEKDFLDTLPEVNGEKLPWGKFTALLHTHPSRQYRQHLWQAQAPLSNQLRPAFLELVRRRNRWARQQGYETYIDLVLAPEGLSRDAVLERYVDLEEATLDTYKLLLGRIRDRTSSSKLAIWDISYVPQARLGLSDGASGFNGSAPDVVALIKALGISWDALHFAPEVTERLPCSCFYWPIHAPENVKLALSHQQGWSAYIEIARAFGQALVAGFTQQPSYLLRQHAPCYSAGMGAFLARIAADSTWIRRRRLLPESRRARLDQLSYDLLILRLRYLMALSVFEYHIYEMPDGDLDVIWGEVQEAFLLLPNVPWSGWVVQPEYILRPIHLQYEVIGEIIASQAINYLNQRFGSLFGNPEVTEFLEQSFYDNGSAHDWVDQVRTATGKFLSNKALFSELVGEE